MGALGQVVGRATEASGRLVSAHSPTPSTLHNDPWGGEGAGADGGGRGGLQHPGAGGAQQDSLEVRILPAETGEKQEVVL